MKMGPRERRLQDAKKDRGGHTEATINRLNRREAQKALVDAENRRWREQQEKKNNPEKK